VLPQRRPRAPVPQGPGPGVVPAERRAIEYEEYLKRIAELARQVEAGQPPGTPAELDTPGKRALYNNLKKGTGGPATADGVAEGLATASRLRLASSSRAAPRTLPCASRARASGRKTRASSQRKRGQSGCCQIHA
jgi:hypothetical protein